MFVFLSFKSGAWKESMIYKKQPNNQKKKNHQKPLYDKTNRKLYSLSFSQNHYTFTLILEKKLSVLLS